MVGGWGGFGSARSPAAAAVQADSFEPVDEFLDVAPQIQRVLSHEAIGKLRIPASSASMMDM